MDDGARLALSGLALAWSIASGFAVDRPVHRRLVAASRGSVRRAAAVVVAFGIGFAVVAGVALLVAQGLHTAIDSPLPSQVVLVVAMFALGPLLWTTGPQRQYTLQGMTIASDLRALGAEPDVAWMIGVLGVWTWFVTIFPAYLFLFAYLMGLG